MINEAVCLKSGVWMKPGVFYQSFSYVAKNGDTLFCDTTHWLESWENFQQQLERGSCAAHHKRCRSSMVKFFLQDLTLQLM